MGGKSDWSCAASMTTVPSHVQWIARHPRSPPRPRTRPCRCRARRPAPAGIGGTGQELRARGRQAHGRVVAAGGPAGVPSAGGAGDAGRLARAQIRSRWTRLGEARPCSGTGPVVSVTELTSPEIRAPVFASTSQANSAVRLGVPGRSSDATAGAGSPGSIRRAGLDPRGGIDSNSLCWRAVLVHDRPGDAAPSTIVHRALRALEQVRDQHLGDARCPSGLICGSLPTTANGSIPIASPL